MVWSNGLKRSCEVADKAFPSNLATRACLLVGGEEQVVTLALVLAPRGDALQRGADLEPERGVGREVLEELHHVHLREQCSAGGVGGPMVRARRELGVQGYNWMRRLGQA